MDYYRDWVTRQSWEFLQKLRRRFRFVLIGGWAVWLYTEQLKSKDIDLVIDLPELDKLKAGYGVAKNERLRKYEMHQGEVEVDIYVPFYSNPGVPAEEILADGRVIGGFQVPSRELLLVLKSVAWESRRASAKGRKDLIDIVGLLETGKLTKQPLRRLFSQKHLESVKELLKRELTALIKVEELNLNQHRVARAKKKWLEALR